MGYCQPDIGRIKAVTWSECTVECRSDLNVIPLEMDDVARTGKLLTVLHVFVKKTQKTPRQNIEIAHERPPNMAEKLDTTTILTRGVNMNTKKLFVWSRSWTQVSPFT